MVIGLGTTFNALTNRDAASRLAPPILKALGIRMSIVVTVVLGTELPGWQRGLPMTSLTGLRWLASICLALVLLVVVEISKWIRRRQVDEIGVVDARRTVMPARALGTRPLDGRAADQRGGEMAKHKKHKEEQTTDASGDGQGQPGSTSEDEEEAVRAGDATAAR